MGMREPCESPALLLVNLGTPAAPTAAAVAAYLDEFLSDPRVVRLPGWLWKPLLRKAILPRRSPVVAKKYASVWMDDLCRANGFDERLQWGGLDRELGERLENAGVRGRQFRHRALVVHLDHARGYKNAEAIAKNRAIRDEVARKKLTRAALGVDQYREDWKK